MIPTGETEVFGEKPVSLPLCAPQILCGLITDWNPSVCGERPAVWLVACSGRTQSPAALVQRSAAANTKNGGRVWRRRCNLKTICTCNECGRTWLGCLSDSQTNAYSGSLHIKFFQFFRGLRLFRHPWVESAFDTTSLNNASACFKASGPLRISVFGLRLQVVWTALRGGFRTRQEIDRIFTGAMGRAGW